MGIINNIKRIFQSDSAAIAAAKRLPRAYVDMLGLDYTWIEDETTGNWFGTGGRVELAEVLDADNETGKFNFWFVTHDENDESSYESFGCEMSVKQSGSAFVFSAGDESIEVLSPVTSKSLEPVLKMAIRHKVKGEVSDA